MDVRMLQGTTINLVCCGGNNTCKSAFGLKLLLRIWTSQFFCKSFCEVTGLEATLTPAHLFDKQACQIKYPVDCVFKWSGERKYSTQTNVLWKWAFVSTQTNAHFPGKFGGHHTWKQPVQVISLGSGEVTALLLLLVSKVAVFEPTCQHVGRCAPTSFNLRDKWLWNNR